MIHVTRRGNGIARLAAAIPRAAQQQTEDAAKRIVGGARQRCPVRTGALRDSITASSAGLHAEVVQAGGGGHTTPEGKPVNYARMIEMGAAKRAGKPFLRPAALAEAPEFPKRLAEAIREAIR